MYTIENFKGSIKSALASRKEKFIVLDVEGYSTARPYNIGYIIADRYGTIYKRVSVAFPATIWENIIDMMKTRQAEEMTKANIQEILQSMETSRRKRKYDFVSCETFKHRFAKDIERYRVKRLFAYNVSFDKSALKRLFGEKDFAKLNLEYCDIITGILTAKLMTRKYIDFCVLNGFITEKGNVMTKAEIVYKYLTNCLDFVEEHTGLADVLIEYQILLTALNSGKKLDFSPCQAWRKLKKFAEDKNISLVPF